MQRFQIGIDAELLHCRYVRSCEMSRFIALLGREDVFDDPERSLDPAQVEDLEACDPLPLKWSDLKYALWHQGGSEHAKEEAHA